MFVTSRRRSLGRAVVVTLLAVACAKSPRQDVAQAPGMREAGLGAGPVTLAVLAGWEGGWGRADGTGSAARFTLPYGVAVDGLTGTVYVADTENHTIRRVTPGGVVTTLAGSARQAGNTDGLGAAARFWEPSGVAVDGAGNVYVADTSNHTIRKVTPGGVVTTLAGSAGQAGKTDGLGAAARFSYPIGVAVDGAGYVYVADSGNCTIRRVEPSGMVTTLAGYPGWSGSDDGTGSAARFNGPTGLAVDGSGTLYVADEGNRVIRKVTPVGVVTTLTPRGLFSDPCGVSVDGAGNVYVADNQRPAIWKVTPDGGFGLMAGSGVPGMDDGTGLDAKFYHPFGLAADGPGNLYVADSGNSTIRKVTPSGAVTTFVGRVRQYGSADGTGSAARFYEPSGLAVDGSGNVYVADQHNDTIRKVTPGGVVTTFAGSAEQCAGADDGTGSDARFNQPNGVALDGSGNIYAADQYNHTIRKVTPDGVVTTLAGSAGQYGSADGTGSGARFNQPFGVAVDGSGNVYVADSENFTIRKVTQSGVVTTLAGSAGQSGSTDGTGSAARFSYPSGVAVDGSGNVYVADENNETIRKVTPGGVVTTLAGSAGQYGSADGMGSDARFNQPNGVALDGSGNLYVADSMNFAIRKVTPARVVTTVVGSPAYPSSVAVSQATGDLYVTVLDAVLVASSNPLALSPSTVSVSSGGHQSFTASGGMRVYT